MSDETVEEVKKRFELSAERTKIIALRVGMIIIWAIILISLVLLFFDAIYGARISDTFFNGSAFGALFSPVGTGNSFAIIELVFYIVFGIGIVLATFGLFLSVDRLGNVVFIVIAAIVTGISAITLIGLLFYIFPCNNPVGSGNSYFNSCNNPLICCVPAAFGNPAFFCPNTVACTLEPGKSISDGTTTLSKSWHIWFIIRFVIVIIVLLLSIVQIILGVVANFSVDAIKKIAKEGVTGATLLNLVSQFVTSPINVLHHVWKVTGGKVFGRRPHHRYSKVSLKNRSYI